MEKEIYDAKIDSEFREPYEDQKEQRNGYLYIHGGFRGTETRFSFFFPDKESYKGRFFQFMAPAEGSENASVGRTGAEDKIGFAVKNGAYFVETNMGVANGIHSGDGSIIYRASAACAEYSRKVAARLYGEHRPYGYIYGGSGGAFKTMSCFENTNAWDGAVPYIHGSPMAIPNVFCVRAHAKRVLRHAFPKIMDAIEPGGSGNPYEGLSAEERQTLLEVTKMGFPMRSWFYYKKLDDGALPVVAGATIGIDKSYFTDFWERPGYLGADPCSSVHRDRIVCQCRVLRVHIPRRKSEEEISAEKEKLNGADSTWKRNRSDYGMEGEIYLQAKDLPAGDVYAYGSALTFRSGKATGLTVTVDRIEGNKVVLAAGFGVKNMIPLLKEVKSGDVFVIDNSDYLAAQTFYRHQTPAGEEYIGWNQFTTASGQSIYPTRELSVGPLIACGSCGSLQTGKFKGKMIVVAATMDESAFPWQADWYRKKVQENLGDKTYDHYRLYFFDHCYHDDGAKTVDELHLVSYLGGLHQALLDLSDWVERGIEPRKSSGYTVEDGQIVLSDSVQERCGLQPIVRVCGNGTKRAEIGTGESVRFRAEISVPEGAGIPVRAEWSFEGEQNYPEKSEIVSGKGIVETCASHTYTREGTYFAVVRVWIQRDGKQDVFTEIANIDRTRVVVHKNA